MSKCFTANEERLIREHMKQKGYVKPPRKKNNVELSPKQEEERKNLVNMDRNLNNALKKKWTDSALHDMAKELASLLASEEQRREEEAKIPNNVNVPELVEDLSSAETEIEFMKTRMMDLETELRDLKEREGYFENIANISKKSFLKMQKQNIWLKNYVEAFAREQNGNNIRMRCAFAEEFSDRDWIL